MWIIIFGLTFFWAGVAALVAWLCNFPVWPVALGMALTAFFFLIFAFSLCKVAGRSSIGLGD